MTPSEHATAVEPIATFDPVAAIDNFFRQIAHRALSLAIWLLAARIIFAFWPRSFDFMFYLLPVAFGCLDAALVAAFMSFWFARPAGRNNPAEPRTMIWISLALLVCTTAWMLLPRLLHH
jgi:hypothetical protein